MAGALRALRHGDGGLALFNGSKEDHAGLIELVLTQAGRGGRTPLALPEGGFHRLAAARTLVLADCGAPPPPGLDRSAHAGTLSFEMSIGRERLIVNCGAFPAGGAEWRDAARATAAHSTLVIADVNSSELKPEGLGRRPGTVDVQRQEANGAHWLEASHDGWGKPFGAVHRRRLYLAESGEDTARRGYRSRRPRRSPSPSASTCTLWCTATCNRTAARCCCACPAAAAGGCAPTGRRCRLEESIYLGGPEPKRAEQVVLTGYADGPQHVKWAISKVK